MSITVTPELSTAAHIAVMPEAPAADAARLIAARRIGAVPVQDRDGRVVGLVSEHDIVRVIATRAQGLRGLAVEEVMTAEAITVCPETPPESALELMHSRALRHLPVCAADGRLIGMVGMGELVRRA
jgi:CBS domain-containing protein